VREAGIGSGCEQCSPPPTVVRVRGTWQRKHVASEGLQSAHGNSTTEELSRCADFVSLSSRDRARLWRRRLGDPQIDVAPHSMELLETY
jgi:hypothetical protein